jgi:biotin synthase
MMDINDILMKTRDKTPLNRAELTGLLRFSPASPEFWRIMGEANRISREVSGNRAEIHAQFALNLAPCAGNCLFCSFAKINGVFDREVQIAPETAVAQARQFESDGANAVFVMTTAHYPFEKFIEISREIRRRLQPGTVMVANIGDQSPGNAQKIKDAGYAGVYHAIRLREGADTGISPQKRKESMMHFRDAGLKIGTCVEPVGPEHSDEEIADMILFTASLNPCYSGAARRISIPGSLIAGRGMISEIRMAHIVATTRLGVPQTVMGNCTHEPCTLGGAAGANLFWAEAGANPRDTEEKTEKGRGDTVSKCKTLFAECGWEVWKGPSRYYGDGPGDITMTDAHGR